MNDCEDPYSIGSSTGAQSRSSIQNLAALLAGVLALLAYFLLPWISIPLIIISGMQLTTLGPLAGGGNLIFVPLTAVLLILASAIGLWLKGTSPYLVGAGQLTSGLGLFAMLSFWSAFASVIDPIKRQTGLPIDIIITLGIGFHLTWLSLTAGMIAALFNLSVGMIGSKT